MRRVLLSALTISVLLATLTALSRPAAADRPSGSNAEPVEAEKSRGNATQTHTTPNADHVGPPPNPPNDLGWPGLTQSIDGPKVFTLGDGFAAGTGVSENLAAYDNSGAAWWNFVLGPFLDPCLRDTLHSAGPRLAAHLGAHSASYACRGANFGHLRNQFDLTRSIWPDDRSTFFADSTFVVSAGLQSVRTADGRTFFDLIDRCRQVWYPACHTNADHEIVNWNDVEQGASEAFGHIAQFSPQATIRVLGYPEIMQPSPGCSRVGGISRHEATWLDEQIRTLNDRLHAAVDAVQTAHPSVDIEWVDITAFLHQGACAHPLVRHVNDHVVGWAFNGSGSIFTDGASFHPTRRGHEASFDALVASL